MTNLRVGDKVLTANGYQPLYALAHQDSESKVEFLQIRTSEHANNPLEISRQHMIFVVGKPYAVPAYTIRPGDRLQTSLRANGAQVLEVTSIQRTGLYAPVTTDGTVVVDGIVSSCYVSIQKQSGGYVELQGGISTGISQHFFSHLTMTPVRLVCMGVATELCQLYDEDGLAYFAKIVFAAAEFADSWHLLIQMVLLPVYLGAMGALYALESFLGPRLALFSLLGAAVAMARAMSKAKHTEKVKEP